VAVNFIPRCTSWAWQREVKGEEGSSLRPGEQAELVFSMVNPLDVDVQIKADPTVFNQTRLLGTDANGETFNNTLAVLSQEQNVEVLTQPFTTTITKFNDMANMHEALGADDREKEALLKAQDDVDVIPERELHKILVRLRFRGIGGVAGAPTARMSAGHWAFYVQMSFTFTTKDAAASNQHEAMLILRFGLGKLSVDLSACSPMGHRKSANR